MTKSFVPALLAGLLASGLFLIVFGYGFGFLFMFLPTLPLFMVGLRDDPAQALYAGIVAALLIALAVGIQGGLVFVFFLALPAWAFARKTLLCRPKNGVIAWFPVGLIILRLTLYGCALVAAAIAFYAGEPGGLPQMLSQNIRDAFADFEGDYGDAVTKLADRWSFLIFSITLWLWGGSLYAHAWLANRLLAHKARNRRPDVAVRPFIMPAWMLSLLAICALASLIGSPQMRFLGQTTLISLMLPYFFAGCALMQQASLRWPSRRFILFFIYFLIFSQFWPALVLSAVGLGQQIKHLSGIGSWSKS